MTQCHNISLWFSPCLLSRLSYTIIIIISNSSSSSSSRSGDGGVVGGGSFEDFNQLQAFKCISIQFLAFE